MLHLLPLFSPCSAVVSWLYVALPLFSKLWVHVHPLKKLFTAWIEKIYLPHLIVNIPFAFPLSLHASIVTWYSLIDFLFMFPELFFFLIAPELPLLSKIRLLCTVLLRHYKPLHLFVSLCFWFFKTHKLISLYFSSPFCPYPFCPAPQVRCLFSQCPKNFEITFLCLFLWDKHSGILLLTLFLSLEFLFQVPLDDGLARLYKW